MSIRPAVPEDITITVSAGDAERVLTAIDITQASFVDRSSPLIPIYRKLYERIVEQVDGDLRPVGEAALGEEGREG